MIKNITTNLLQFINDPSNAGYAGDDEKKWTKEKDSSTTISFEKGSWKSHDNFFGGEPYGGREVIFYNSKPVWMMVYYGWVEEGQEADPVYEILREALKQKSGDYQPRGPKEYKQNNFTYSNSWKGNVERFSGEEKIEKSGKLIYRAYYNGGFVDQRRSN